MSYTPEQVEALEKSIEHWEDNCWKVKRGFQPSVKASDCACCVFVEMLKNRSCAGCPVYEYTSSPLCVGTPYIRVQELLDSPDLADRWDELLVACQEEYAFLSRLLSYKDL